MNHSLKRRRQALHQTHHHYYLNISVEAANLSDWQIESNRNFFCPNWNALPDRVGMNQFAKYLDSRSFRSKVCVQTHTHTTDRCSTWTTRVVDKCCTIHPGTHGHRHVVGLVCFAASSEDQVPNAGKLGYWAGRVVAILSAEASSC